MAGLSAKCTSQLDLILSRIMSARKSRPQVTPRQRYRGQTEPKYPCPGLFLSRICIDLLEQCFRDQNAVSKPVFRGKSVGLFIGFSSLARSDPFITARHYDFYV